MNGNKLKTRLITKILIFVLLSFNTFLFAKEGDVVVRLRATNISPNEDSKLFKETDKSTGLGGVLYGSSGAELNVSSETIPELDITYYLTNNFATELVLALGSKHDVSITGMNGGAANPDLGEINILPPTLLGQWHFNPDQTFDPYVGVGVAYIRAMDNGLREKNTPIAIRVDKDSFAPVLQFGMDYNINNKWLLNLDVKRFWYNTDVEGNAGAATGGKYVKIDDLDVDPWVTSIGVGYRF